MVAIIIPMIAVGLRGSEIPLVAKKWIAAIDRSIFTNTAGKTKKKTPLSL